MAKGTYCQGVGPPPRRSATGEPTGSAASARLLHRSMIDLDGFSAPLRSESAARTPSHRTTPQNRLAEKDLRPNRIPGARPLAAGPPETYRHSQARSISKISRTGKFFLIPLVSRRCGAIQMSIIAAWASISSRLKNAPVPAPGHVLWTSSHARGLRRFDRQNGHDRHCRGRAE